MALQVRPDLAEEEQAGRGKFGNYRKPPVVKATWARSSSTSVKSWEQESQGIDNTGGVACYPSRWIGETREPSLSRNGNIIGGGRCSSPELIEKDLAVPVGCK